MIQLTPATSLAIRSRKITEETCKKFNVRVDAGPVIRFPYYAGGGSLPTKNETSPRTSPGQVRTKRPTLRPAELWKRQDCRDYRGRNGCPVCLASPTQLARSFCPQWGQGCEESTLQYQLKYLLGFDEIVLMFDNDDAGQQAAEECVGLFPSDRFSSPL